jgi:hypothetical protein
VIWWQGVFSHSAEARNERNRQRETARDGTTSRTPVMDMHFCIDNLDAIRSEAGDFPLKEFSDYWAPDSMKTTTTNGPNTFVPNRLIRGSNPLWAPFYDSGETRLEADGSLEADPDHPPFFRVSQELFGRMLHTFKRKYVDSDEKRKNDGFLKGHVESFALVVKGKMSDACGNIRDRREELIRNHDDLMATDRIPAVTGSGNLKQFSTGIQLPLPRYTYWYYWYCFRDRNKFLSGQYKVVEKYKSELLN